jgi:SnoaL-like domain
VLVSGATGGFGNAPPIAPISVPNTQAARPGPSNPGGHVVHPFGAALEARDIDAALALHSPDVVFHSPIVVGPYRGRDTVAPILHAIAGVLTDFRYVREIGAAGAADHALAVRGRVGDWDVAGVDLLHVGETARSTRLVMVRPLSGANALTEAMRAQLAL